MTAVVPIHRPRGAPINRKQRNPNRWRLIDERLALLRQTGRIRQPVGSAAFGRIGAETGKRAESACNRF